MDSLGSDEGAAAIGVHPREGRAPPGPGDPGGGGAAAPADVALLIENAPAAQEVKIRIRPIEDVGLVVQRLSSPVRARR
jgi:hypothetical protein